MLLSLSVPVQSKSSPTTLTVSYHPPISREPSFCRPSFRGQMNRGQQLRGSSTRQIQCKYCKQFSHFISACREREKPYDSSVFRLSVAVSAPAPALQSSVGSLSSDQLSQIASYLTQTLGITGASSTSDSLPCLLPLAILLPGYLNQISLTI